MEDEWRFCVVRGYHVYKDAWDPYLGDGFTTKHERNNPHNKYIRCGSPISGCKEEEKSRTLAKGDIQGVLPVHSPWRYYLAVAVHW